MAINDSKKTVEDKRRRYVVKDKDTLESIAKKQLRDIRLAALIYEINKHMLPLRMEKGKQVAQPRSGTSIWLPSDAEIGEFRGRLYSTAPNNPPSFPAPEPGGASLRASSPQEEPFQKFGQNLQGGQSASVTSDDLMGAAVAKSQARQSNIEKVLGSIATQRTADVGRIRYIVRLSDTLDGVAIKHPALKDVNLWPLLARLNDLADGIDASGRPLAELKRGMVLDIPFPSEIDVFRSGAQAEQSYPEDEPASDHHDAPAANLPVTPPLPQVLTQSFPQPLPQAQPLSQTFSQDQPLTQPLLQSGVASPALSETEELEPEPLPASLFQSYQRSQPTVPLKPIERNVAPTTSVAPVSPQASGIATPSSSPPAPTPAPSTPSTPTPTATPAFPPAVDPLVWGGPQAAETQQIVTQVLPQQTKPSPMPASVVSPVPESSPIPSPTTKSLPTEPAPLTVQQTTPLPSQQSSPSSLGGWQQSTSNYLPVPAVIPWQPAPEHVVLAPHSPAQHQGTPPVPLQPVLQPQQIFQPLPQTETQPLTPTQASQLQTQMQSQPQPQQFVQSQPATILQQPPLPGQSQSSTTAMPVERSPASVGGQQSPTTVGSSMMPTPFIKPINRPSAADIMKRAPIVIGDRYMWDLDRSVRLVKSAVRWDPAIGVFRSQLEVLYGGTWYPVIFYEVFPHGAVRHEYVGGGKRKSVKMDLPPSAMQELADNDLVNNWQAYCQRFVTQLIGPKS